MTLIVINRRISPSVPADPTALPLSSDPNSGTSDTSGGLLPSKEVRILVINATPGAAVGGRADPDGRPGGGDGAEKENGDANEEERKNQRRQQRMRGGYVGLMNCVFAAQKAASDPSFVYLPRSSDIQSCRKSRSISCPFLHRRSILPLPSSCNKPPI